MCVNLSKQLMILRNMIPYVVSNDYVIILTADSEFQRW